MKRFLVLFCLLLLSACALYEMSPEEIEEDEIPTPEEYFEEPEPETFGEMLDAEKEKNQTEEPEPEDDEPENKIDITVNEDLGTARAEGIFYYEKISETFQFTDIDAIIFDLSSILNTKLEEIRIVTYVNGQPYLKPSQEPIILEKDAVSKEKKTNFQDIPIIFTKEDGLIRGVGCDFKESIIRIQFKNNGTTEIPLYRVTTPRIRNALVTYVNKKISYPLHCEGNAQEIPANGTLECIKAGVFFVLAKTTTVFHEESQLDPSMRDELVINKPGYNEQMKFLCTPDAVAINTTVPTNQTNSS